MRVVLLAGLVAAAGCKKSSYDGNLPPAEDWRGNDMVVDPQAIPKAAVPNTGNPHEGMGLNAQGQPEGDDDDDGMPPGHGAPSVDESNNPHPTPGGPIDPKLMVRGTLKLDPKAAGRVTAGGTLYLSVKKLGPDGKPMKGVLAVDRLAWTRDGAAFDLTDKMGGDASGDLILVAHYDQDGDPMTTQPGDVLGQLTLRVPADKLQLVLDTVAP